MEAITKCKYKGNMYYTFITHLNTDKYTQFVISPRILGWLSYIYSIYGETSTSDRVFSSSSSIDIVVNHLPHSR